MIRKPHVTLGIPTGVLIQDYKLNNRHQLFIPQATFHTFISPFPLMIITPASIQVISSLISL